VPQKVVIPFIPPGLPIPHTYTIRPVQFHVFVLATFASLIAPFGGFFASGLKRTFKIKDFGDSIPGHGGMTDRMDCQFIMGTIAFFYYSSFIATHQTTVGSVLELAITGLTPEEQLDVVKILGKHLVNQELLSPNVHTATSYYIGLKLTWARFSNSSMFNPRGEIVSALSFF
jgi:phosphatidate cytidylyltransferase